LLADQAFNPVFQRADTRGSPLYGGNMATQEINEDMIFQCLAAAQQSQDMNKTAESFVDV
jgi:hypothetical protein